MLAQDRQDSILEELSQDGSVKVSKLTKMFQVSIETIRRDLEFLEKQGFLKRVYGGAVLKKNSVDKLNFSNRKNEFIEEKKEVAQIAARYVEEGQSIALSGGTTSIEIARELKKNFKNLTIITNSLLVTNELSDIDGFNVILTGGILNHKEYAFYGEISKNVLLNFMVDKAFIPVSGVSLTKGITEYMIEEVQIQRAMMEIAQEVIVLADSSKIDGISLVKIADLDEVNLVITDSNLDNKILDKYIKKGIEIVNK